jgi:hypothetical protein
MLKRFGFALAVFTFCEGTSVLAQDPASADQPSPAVVKSWQYSGTVDSAFSYNPSHPASGANLLRNFDSNANAFSLSALTLDLQYTGKHLGFHVDTGYGEMYRTIGAADPWRGPNQYATQLYGSYKPSDRSALQLDFGKFYTSAGAEVPDILGNFNYSRSLLFVLGAPYYHFGLRATIPVTKAFTAGFQIVNGWNDVRDNNTGKTVALTSTLAKAKWNWSQTYIVGPEKTDSNQGFRHLYDAVLNVTPRRWVRGYLEFLYGSESRISSPVPGTGRDQWTGFATAAKFMPIRKLSFSPRWEYYNDSTGFTSGLPQTLTEWTGTAEYNPFPFAVWRLEYRADHSNRRFFDHSSRSNQQTVLIALILSKKGAR